MSFSAARYRTFAASRKTKAATGFRSGLEVTLAKDLENNNVPYTYESARLPYTRPAIYIIDFALPEQAIIIETKGQFTPEDRTKMLRVKAEYPDLDIRLLFNNPNARISKTSKTTYGSWCKKHGFPFEKGGILPSEWLSHRPNTKQREAFERIINGKENN